MVQWSHNRKDMSFNKLTRVYISYSWGLVLFVILGYINLVLGIWKEVCYKVCTSGEIEFINIRDAIIIVSFTALIYIFTTKVLGKHKQIEMMLLILSIPTVLISTYLTIMEILVLTLK